MLYDADLNILGESIRVVPGKYIDKAVQSNRANVVNIKSFIKTDLSTEEFAARLFEFLVEKFISAEKYELTSKDMVDINRLCEEKYITWEWNFGYSPTFGMKKEFSFGEEKGILKLRVVKGYIQELDISGSRQLQEIAEQLKNCRYRYEDINEKLSLSKHKKSSSILELLF